MKKTALLTLVILVALPGCCNRQKSAQQIKKNNVVKYAETRDAMSMSDLGYSEYADDEDELEDEDSELSFDDEDDDALEVAVNNEDTEEVELYSWVDAQTDDEFKPVYFTFNHYGIRADQKQAAEYDIEQVKQLLSDSGTTAQPTVVIEGHACQEGTPAYNLALSEKRAKIVADHFVAAGIDRSAIKVVGRGQECPVISAASRDAREPNRRVEVRVIYT